jgi:CHRD domain-containing protein
VKKLVLIAVLLVTLAYAGVATAVAVKVKPHRFNAHLTTRVMVPKPIHTKKKAFGVFVGSYVVQKKDIKLTWRLAFTKLSGKATGATLRQGKPGLIGSTITVLCKPCKSGNSATTLLRKSVAKALASGQAYVQLYTVKNPAGELRGQIRVK